MLINIKRLGKWISISYIWFMETTDKERQSWNGTPYNLILKWFLEGKIKVGNNCYYEYIETKEEDGERVI